MNNLLRVRIKRTAKTKLKKTPIIINIGSVLEGLQTKKDIDEYCKNNRTHTVSDTKPQEIKKLQKTMEDFYKSDDFAGKKGKFYEQYIGAVLETIGLKVSYYGMIKGSHDLGRDLICKDKQGNNIFIVQCKCWECERKVQWGDIAKLVTTILYYKMGDIYEKNSINEEFRYSEGSIVHAVFFTSASLSTFAQHVAKALNVIVYDNWLLKLVIKCKEYNKAKKLFYLPFDEEYFNITIDIANGDMYTYKVEDAVLAGFIYAHR